MVFLLVDAGQQWEAPAYATSPTDATAQMHEPQSLAAMCDCKLQKGLHHLQRCHPTSPASRPALAAQQSG